MNLKIKKLENDVKGILDYANQTDAGMDLCSNEDITLLVNTPTKIKTGVAIKIPDGYVGLIWDKSSIASKGIKTMGGVIDSGYTGEIMIVVNNLNKEEIKIEKNQKIAQLIIQPYLKIEKILEVEDLGETDRGEKGFGSSGKF